MLSWTFEIRSRPFIVSSLGFVAITLLVFTQITDFFDHEVIEFFHSISGNPFVDLLMVSITEIGDIYYMLIFSVVLLIIRKTRKIGLALMILLVLATILTGYIKCGVDRERPGVEFEESFFPIEISSDTFALFCEGGYNASYPSGHAARSAIFGLVFGFVLSERFPRGCYLMLLYPLLMSVSRMYVLQHYPMDVIGGAVLGFALAGVIAKKAKLRPVFAGSKN